MANIEDIFEANISQKDMVNIEFTPAEIVTIAQVLKTEVMMETLETIEGSVEYGAKYNEAKISKTMKQTLTINDNYERYFVMATEILTLAQLNSPKRITRTLANFLVFLIRDVSKTLEFSPPVKASVAANGEAILAKLAAAGASFDTADLLPPSPFNGPIGLA